MAEFLQALARPLVTCTIEAPKFLVVLLRDCERCPGNFSPCLLFLSFHDIEGIDGIYSRFSDELFCVAVFPLILWSKIELNIVNRITFLVLLFWFLITGLPFHAVTLQSAIRIS